ncbi:MAG: citrate transporter [Ruminococcaceae bacterium]|nr:citrate transporter [Oscillospiraceae bacterium]
MAHSISSFLKFLKSEIVLTVAVLLAAVSSLIVPPDQAYWDYIDWDTLLLLFSLMAVMAGLQKLGVFSRIGNGLLRNIRGKRALLWTLIFLPFVFSMLITNDVGLITFVPFGLIVLRLAGQESLAVPVVVLQTVAANLGSMLTPMGNPQNLYLYAQCGMSLPDFLRLTLPYTIVSAAVLFAAVFLFKNGKITYSPVSDSSMSSSEKRQLMLYALLFLLCLLSVAKVLPPLPLALAVALVILLLDRSILLRVDYALLGTFIGFFVFIGNMGRIEAFRSLLSSVLEGHEQLVAILASQVISNVPAALLLSGFTENWEALIIGTNLGGLGTLIASMASLISYKQIGRLYPQQRGRYLFLFTVVNIAVLMILLLFGFFISS